MKLFTYGSLKRGFWLNGHLENATFLGEFKTTPDFTMVNLGSYPGVILQGDTAITGEVWEITDQELEHLDMAEGYPDFYDRKVIDTSFGDAILYFLPGEYLSRPKVEAGEWFLDIKEDIYG